MTGNEPTEQAMEWWEQPIEVHQDHQDRDGVTKRRVRLTSVNWTVDAYPLGRSWSDHEPTIVIDGWLSQDVFNTQLLIRMLRDAVNYCAWGGVVDPPTAQEIAALTLRADDV